MFNNYDMKISMISTVDKVTSTAHATRVHLIMNVHATFIIKGNAEFQLKIKL